MDTPWIVLISALGGLLLLGFLFSFYAYTMTFKRKRNSLDLQKDLGIDVVDGYDLSELSEKLRQRPYEEVKITSFDGLDLVGRYYVEHKGAPVHLLCHGYGSSPVHDFSASSMQNLYEGENYLMIYQRAHGKSGGRAMTFGYKECRDVASWVDFLIEREGNEVEIILGGVSMGAATVLMAASLDLPKNVKCAIADCPYSTAKEAIMLTSKRMGFPPSLVYPFVKLGARIFAGFNPDLASPVDAVKNSKIPILLIHGECDKIVPKYMSDAIYQAHGGYMEYFTFPGADHGMSCLIDIERYKNLCREFMAKYIKG